MESNAEPNVGRAALDTFPALMSQEPEVAEAFLLAAVYSRAIHTDSSPRDVVENLFKALPETEHWPSLRRGLEAMLEDE